MDMTLGPEHVGMAYVTIEVLKFVAQRFVQEQSQLRLLQEITTAQKSIASSLTNMAEMQQSTALILRDLADKVQQDRTAPAAEEKEKCSTTTG